MEEQQHCETCKQTNKQTGKRHPPCVSRAEKKVNLRKKGPGVTHATRKEVYASCQWELSVQKSRLSITRFLLTLFTVILHWFNT